MSNQPDEGNRVTYFKDGPGTDDPSCEHINTRCEGSGLALNNPATPTREEGETYRPDPAVEK